MDKDMFHRILNGTDLQVDYMKVYPTTITPFTKIKEWYDEGSYKPYGEEVVNGVRGEKLIQVIKYIKTWMKPWIRLNRIYRDFPNQTEKEIGAVGGIMMTNLRQIVLERMRKENIICKCVRCREVKLGTFNWENSAIFIRTYRASDGIEYFISVESKNQHTLHGFVRLRLNDSKFKKRLKVLCDDTSQLCSVALIRELHVYGSLVRVNTDSKGQVSQHYGIGKRLLLEAETIARNSGYNKIAVISGVGVRNYYRNRGYKLKEYGYMIKKLNSDTEQNDQEINSNVIIILIFVFLFGLFLLKLF
jgi:ELP3 family radical SAM enzyme/protein acetyltransferase